jgi:hypothetical protein
MSASAADLDLSAFSKKGNKRIGWYLANPAQEFKKEG